MILRTAAVLVGLLLIAVAFGFAVSPWLALAVPGVALAAVGLLADSGDA